MNLVELAVKAKQNKDKHNAARNARYSLLKAAGFKTAEAVILAQQSDRNVQEAILDKQLEGFEKLIKEKEAK